MTMFITSTRERGGHLMSEEGDWFIASYIVRRAHLCLLSTGILLAGGVHVCKSKTINGASAVGMNIVRSL